MKQGISNLPINALFVTHIASIAVFSNVQKRSFAVEVRTLTTRCQLPEVGVLKVRTLTAPHNGTNKGTS
jgi:hypothetical protein